MANNKVKDPNKVTFKERIRKPVFWYNVFAIPILLGAWNKFVHAIDNIGGIDGTKLLLTIGFMGEIIVFAIAAYVDTSEKDTKKPSASGGVDLLTAADKEQYLRHLRDGAAKVEQAFNQMAQDITSTTTAKINPAFDNLQTAANNLTSKINTADVKTGSVDMEKLASNASALHNEFEALVQIIQSMKHNMDQVSGSVNPSSYSAMDSNLNMMNSTIESVNQKMREMESFLDAFQNLRRN